MKFKIISKLKCKRGASIVIALMIFLLCSLAGASAFLMAASNVGRYSHSDEQDYYSASSAALMLVDALDGLTYESGTVTYDYNRTWEYDGGSNERNISDGYTLTIPASGKWSEESGENTAKLRGSSLELCGKILNQCDALVPYLVPGEWYDSVKEDVGAPKKPAADAPEVSYSFTVTVSGDSRFGTVNCLLIMNSSYDLNFTFSDEGGGYAISVYWQATLKQAKTSGEPDYQYTRTEAGVLKSGSLKQTDRLTVTAKWEKANVTISRGALQ